MARTMYLSLSESHATASGPLILIGVWIIGEYCNILVDSSQPKQDGEAPVTVSGSDVVQLMQVLLRKDSCDTETREYIITAVRRIAPARGSDAFECVLCLHWPRVS